ncbi:predicted protein [Postia placenta Mad-698-R]|uniref:Uncharacterized protein n=1 Tax=Postia placenta MAD-698-R-SB12 TaxID=670580 RepID=A0A1X6NB79_9APHY|nr:hypothetical protein POSPLADRAFT_1043358 [Postia placenta MAD-698-R-SB12]EED82033.1 predicted protein [Postia placenta Mad-698-R]OSX65762.1 hypothetical protein POSPLADRAFT_1043358 [Postia placenta MAD-698-R-SB12]
MDLAFIVADFQPESYTLADFQPESYTLADFQPESYTLAGRALEEIDTVEKDYILAILNGDQPYPTSKSTLADTRGVKTRAFFEKLQNLDFEITQNQRRLRVIIHTQLQSQARARELPSEGGNQLCAPHSTAVRQQCERILKKCIPQRASLIVKYVNEMDALTWVETEQDEWQWQWNGPWLQEWSVARPNDDANTAKYAYRDYVLKLVLEVVNNMRNFLDDPSNFDPKWQSPTDLESRLGYRRKGYRKLNTHVLLCRVYHEVGAGKPLTMRERSVRIPQVGSIFMTWRGL